MKFPRRMIWSAEEDEAIKRLVEKHGSRAWKKVIADLEGIYGVKGRTGKQCRERWLNHLSSRISSVEWTESDETLMFDLHSTYKNSWSEMAKHMNGRSENCIKNHFYSSIRKNLSIYVKSHPEARGANLQDLLRDPAVSPHLLKPNYKFISQKNEPSVLRRSSRVASRANYKIETSDEDDIQPCRPTLTDLIDTPQEPQEPTLLPKYCQEDKKPPLLIIPTVSRAEELTDAFTPYNTFSPNSLVITKRFIFPDDDEDLPVYRPILGSPKNLVLPAFSSNKLIE